jgi:eukaryotic-like serine/threonine-protein kinase
MADAHLPPGSATLVSELQARIGTVIGQRYKLHALLGEGGMAAVYLAEDLTNHKRVAIKLLKQEHASDPQVLARFEREAKAMSVLVHEHLVAALGFGASPEGDLCLVMELVEGETLRSVLRRIKPFPPHGVVAVADQIAEGLAYAHGFGVVHRDFKPENVMVTWLPGNRPWIKILDFGMARILFGPPGTPLTRQGAVFGTPEYMPPEQAMGQPVDASADQYALGVIVFEMISGQRPFKAKSALEMVQMKIRNAAPSLLDLVPELPPAAAAVVARMLAKQKSDRFPDVLQAAAALSQALRPTSGPR